MNYDGNKARREENIRIGVTIALVSLLMLLLSVAGTIRNSKEVQNKDKPLKKTELSQIQEKIYHQKRRLQRWRIREFL